MTNKNSNVLVNKVIKEGDLSVWHIPQIPGTPIRISVDSIEDGFSVMQILSVYDAFQLEENIKPDYANANGLDIWESGEWVTWYDDDIDEYGIEEGELVKW
jgi:hypothetical protein